VGEGGGVMAFGGWVGCAWVAWALLRGITAFREIWAPIWEM